eukprot:472586_1
MVVFTDLEHGNYVFVSIVVASIVIFVLILLLYKLFCVAGNIDMIQYTIIPYVAIIQFISFIFSYICWIIQLTVFEKDENTVMYYFVSAVMYLNWTLGWVLIYIFMVTRLYYTYKESIYKMSKYSLVFHTIIMIIIPVWYIALTIIDHTGDNGNNEFNQYFSAVVIGFPIIFVGLVRLIYQFNRKLYLLILSQKQTIVTEEDIQEMELSPRQVSTLSTMTKHVLLGSIILTFFALFLSIIPIITFIDMRLEIAYILYEWFLALLVVVNTICVYLGFSINKKEYDVCCDLCHWKCRKLCENCAQKNLTAYNRRRKNYITLK